MKRFDIRIKDADVAQLVEQLTRNEQVIGSTPIVGSNIYVYMKGIVNEETHN